jgi:uncharacterized protein
MKDIVFVFARAPRLGTVKRRLARDIGERAALRFYIETLSRTLRRLAADRRFRTIIAATPDHVRARWPVRVPVAPQGPGDLGARMHRIFRRHPHARVAIVGSDIPDLAADDVARAFRLLGRTAACFGPAADGGYWLVAFGPRRRSAPFVNVRWSTEWALADTLANLAGRRASFLRVLRDVDRVEDLLAKK